MKTFLLLIVVALSISVNAQTTSNNAFDLTYIAYANNQYLVSITNKQSCAAAIQLNWNSRSSDSSIIVAAATTIQVYITASYINGSYIKLKTSDCCIAGCNSGYISVPVYQIVLPLSDPVYTNVPRRVATHEIKIFDQCGVLLKKALVESKWKAVAQMPPGLYVVHYQGTRQKMLRL